MQRIERRDRKGLHELDRVGEGRQAGKHCLHEKCKESLFLGGEQKLEAGNHGRAGESTPCHLLIHHALLADDLLQLRMCPGVHGGIAGARGFLIIMPAGG